MARNSAESFPGFAAVDPGLERDWGSMSRPAPSQWLLAIFGVLALIGVFVSDRRGHVGLLWSMLVTFLTFLALARSSLVG